MARLNQNDFYIVGIGASAGGLEPIQQLFDVIPKFNKAAFVIVQHLSPDFVSLMDELLRKHTEMKVSTINNDEIILPNRVYLIPRKKFIKIHENKFVLFDKNPGQLSMPIDVFFRSLGEQLKEKAIGIILSGSGTDGSRGLRTIIEEGGIVLAQDELSAQFDGMPKAALDTELVDFVGTPHEIAERLIKICKGETRQTTLDEFLVKENKAAYQSILSEIQLNKQIDFKLYKPGTLIRRIEKRIQILGLTGLPSYYEYILAYPEEIGLLSKEFLIGVTKFFRDNEAFEILKNKVIPVLYQNVSKSYPVRIWSIACSTGEEAYSLAILMNEYKRLNKLNANFKIFATDIDPTAIAKAGKGKYGGHIRADIPPDLLEKYFRKTESGYEIIKDIREHIVFANHDILKAPSFIKMDLIVSRNFLIYIDSKPQKLLLNKFHYALNPNGFLFLGSSESLSDKEDDFEMIDARWRIFKSKRSISSIAGISQDDVSSVPNRLDKRYHNFENLKPLSSIDRSVNFDEVLIEHFAPQAYLFVNKNLDVLYLKGNMEDFLKFPSNPSDFNLNSMVERDKLVIFVNGIKEALEKTPLMPLKIFPLPKMTQVLKLISNLLQNGLTNAGKS